MPGRSKQPLLRMTGIEKSFPGVRALKGIDLELYSGEVLALLGENGAGKSTLIKILGGAHLPDQGAIEIDERRVAISSPHASQSAGIGIIYQEFNLVPGLPARSNIFLGQEPGVLMPLRSRLEQHTAREMFSRLGVDIDPERPCRMLTVSQQQIVEIVKALHLQARIIVMDEPSAALTLNEVKRLFGIIRELKAAGIGVIYISHRLDEIFEIADRVMVLRDGEYIGTRDIDELDRATMIEMMVGRTIDEEFPKQSSEIGPERLKVSGLSRGREVKDVSFSVHQGEVLGLTGLVGAGRTETARILFGADRPHCGSIHLDGRQLRLRNPRDAIRAGICLLTEDRKSQGLVLGMSAQENFGLPNADRFARYGFLEGWRERSAFSDYVDSLRIKVSAVNQRTDTLSGGNQQKVVLAKWLARNANVLIFDEPTRGIDVGAKLEIYLLINRLAEQGKAIIMISSELPEVLGMSDRILVMHSGSIAGEIRDVGSATQEDVMMLATGGAKG